MNYPCLRTFHSFSKQVLFSLSTLAVAYSGSAWAAAAQVRGQVGLIWDYQSDLGAQKSRVLGYRLPFSLDKFYYTLYIYSV